MNVAFLIGNLGREPEIREFNNGGRIANLTVATSRFWKDKETGERKDRTTWHNVVLRSPYAIDAARGLAKGQKVVVKGSIETRKYQDKDGKDRYVTEVVVDYDGEFGAMVAKQASGEAVEAGTRRVTPDPLGDDIPF